MSDVNYQAVDAKAFKGKGAAVAARNWRRLAFGELTAVQLAMAELCEQSRAVSGRMFSVGLFRRARAGEVSVRWRWNTGRHCTWADLAEQVAALPSSMKRYYTDMQRVVCVLNALEQRFRAEMKCYDRLIQHLEEVDVE